MSEEQSAERKGQAWKEARLELVLQLLEQAGPSGVLFTALRDRVAAVVTAADLSEMLAALGDRLDCEPHISPGQVDMRIRLMRRPREARSQGGANASRRWNTGGRS